MFNVETASRFVSNANFVLRSVLMNTTVELEQEFINDVLSIYKAEHKYVTNAVYDNQGILTCKLKSTKYPYTESDVFDYVTSVTATLFVCQLTYVLFAQLVKENILPSLASSYEEYVYLRDTAKLKFLRFDFKFIGKVSNNDSIIGRMKFIELIEKKNKVFYKSSFIIGNGIKGELITTVDKR